MPHGKKYRLKTQRVSHAILIKPEISIMIVDDIRLTAKYFINIINTCNISYFVIYYVNLSTLQIISRHCSYLFFMH